jgi:hypothetical protein
LGAQEGGGALLVRSATLSHRRGAHCAWLARRVARWAERTTGDPFNERRLSASRHAGHYAVSPRLGSGTRACSALRYVQRHVEPFTSARMRGASLVALRPGALFHQVSSPWLEGLIVPVSHGKPCATPKAEPARIVARDHQKKSSGFGDRRRCSAVRDVLGEACAGGGFAVGTASEKRKS